MINVAYIKRRAFCMRIRASAERQWRWRIKSDGGKSKTWRWCFEYCTFLQKIFSITKIGRFLRRFDINSPFQNTVYPKTKDSFPKYKLELTIGIHACIDHAFVNIREFKMPRQPTATKTSHEKWSHIFSVSIMIIPTRLLCQMQANSSRAEFLSTISKLIKRKKILSLLVYVLHKTWN